MKLEQIIEIIKKKNMSEEYFGYDESKRILEKIKSDEKLLKKLEELTDEYWKEVQESGIIIYSDLIYETKSGAYEDITTRHSYIDETKKVPTLVLQQKRPKR